MKPSDVEHKTAPLPRQHRTLTGTTETPSRFSGSTPAALSDTPGRSAGIGIGIGIRHLAHRLIRSGFHPVTLLFVVALLLRLYNLGGQSLWLDEGSTWQTIQHGWGFMLAELVAPTSAYPLYHLLLKVWVALAGDSEWALRFPSALAGAAAVVALYVAANELQQPPRRRQQSQHKSSRTSAVRLLSPTPFALVSAGLLLISPFAIWYAQEVKVYSLFLLLSVLMLWSFHRALRLSTRRAWVVYAAIALVSVFVHRLAILLLIASYMAAIVTRDGEGRDEGATGQRCDGATGRGKRIVVQWVLVGVAGAGIIVAMVLGLGEEGATTGAHIPAGPSLALWLTFVRFSLDRGPGEIAWWWLLPFAAMLVWGGAALLHDVRRWFARRGAGGHNPHEPATAMVLACFLVVPLVLFLVQLMFTRFYETRYLMQIYPAWLLLLAYPLKRDASGDASEDAGKAAQPGHKVTVRGANMLLAAAAAGISVVVLLQPGLGLFSGAAVKEQYREAVGMLAEQVHPDDVVVVHPAYLEPLYTYYMHRLSSDPPPEPTLFAAFKQGQTRFTEREWHIARRKAFAGHTRSFLMIAPDHARTVDVPNKVYNDEYGLVGIYFQYSREVKKWPCGIWRYNGVHVYCQESPEAYVTGEPPRPATPMHARFGEHLQLLGYTLKATSEAGVGVYRAGGVVPISLFWDVTQQVNTDYSMFLHLCRDCDMPPAASNDGQPLHGYLPTSVWLPGKPARDDRAIALPADMETGRYTLLMGWYKPSNPAPEARLPVHGGPHLEHNRLVLGTVEVVSPR